LPAGWTRARSGGVREPDPRFETAPIAEPPPLVLQTFDPENGLLALWPLGRGGPGEGMARGVEGHEALAFPRGPRGPPLEEVHLLHGPRATATGGGGTTLKPRMFLSVWTGGRIHNHHP